METVRIRRTEEAEARGIVVVIDVIRAFTVAAYALANGARALWLVRDTPEAFALRERCPDALLIGEVDGRLIPGFDHNNSTARMARAAVHGRLLIQRTGAGTQGAVGAVNAAHILVASLVNARATAAYAWRLAEEVGLPIALLPTSTWDDPRGIEDDVCADYIQALMLGDGTAGPVIEEGLEALRTCGRLEMFGEDSDFPAADVPAFMARDRFPFAMVGERRTWNGITYVEVTRREVGAGYGNLGGTE